MLHQIKNTIRKFTPEFVLLGYHFALAKLAASFYGHPSSKLYVVGITGTKGKTSTANYIWSVLRASGLQTGQLGTASIRIGEKEMLNSYHMTMPGPFVIQKLLRKMVAAGCTHVVMEVTSEGIKLSRHVGIVFDCAVFTNLTPEHLPSHGGSFENYKQTKGRLFASLMEHAKQLKGKYVPRVIIANNDDEHKDFFLNFSADLKITYGLKEGADWLAENIRETSDGVDFVVKNEPCHLSIPGKFNVYNALPAMALGGRVLGVLGEDIRRGLASLKIMEGRMQKIDAGQNFTVIVDYAHEKVSMNAVLDTARNMAAGHKVIVLLGAEGGGRDRAKRPAMGEAAGKKADFVICSNVDPYEDDPYPIANDIAVSAEQNGKIRDQNLFVILDRREGIAKALSLAGAGDIVLITGKGAEQSMIISGKTIPWDDRIIVKEELLKLNTK